MIIIRPIQTNDYDFLREIAVESGHGFTSLPVNEPLLRKRISRSKESFLSEVNTPGEQSYLFVMEDTASGEIVGTSGIEAAVGLDSPFYHYHLGKVIHSSRELNVYNTVETLTLCNDHTGMTEICSLFLREKARINNNGRFLSRFRFLFMGEHSERFSDRIIAEMRGVSDKVGSSPFWAWLQEHFFSIDFPTADYLTGTGNKVFIAELMPKHPIYVNLLSKEAQAVINQVHQNTVPALRLLESEGFSRSGYVDIFDGGPTVTAQKRHIRTIKHSRHIKMKINAGSNKHSNKEGRQQNYIICNTKMEDFRALQLPVTISEDDEYLPLSREVADHLLVNEGDILRVIVNE